MVTATWTATAVATATATAPVTVMTTLGNLWCCVYRSTHAPVKTALKKTNQLSLLIIFDEKEEQEIRLSASLTDINN